MRWPRSPRSADAAASRCWSAARCSISRRCAKDLSNLAAGGRRGEGAARCAARPSKGGPHCTPSSPRRSRTAARLDANDGQRIQRALEVFELSGRAAVGTAGRARESGRDAVRSRRAGTNRAQSCIATSPHVLTRCWPQAWSTSFSCCGERYSLDGDDGLDALRRLSPGLAVYRRRWRSRASCASAPSPRPDNWPSDS